MSELYNFFLFSSFFYLIILFTLVIVIPGFLFKYFIDKDGYNITFLKSCFEIFIAKITCSLIGLLIGGSIYAFLLFFLRKIGVSENNFEKSILVILQVGVYFFFYYKFLNSTLSFFIFDEEARKNILKKFILISEILSSFFFKIIFFGLFVKYSNIFGINFF